MDRLNIFKIILWLWVLWHLGFGLLATFAPEAGASLVGWSAESWDTNLITMSTQYGMVMILLALMFLIMALDPQRYLGLIWVAVAEQLLGIAYGGYIFTQFGELTITQLLLQVVINTVVIILFIGFWLRLRDARQP